jgi:hypothetical protein
VLVALAALATIHQTKAEEVTLPSPTYSGQFVLGAGPSVSTNVYTQVIGPGVTADTQTWPAPGGSIASASVTIETTPSPRLSITATTDAFGPGQASSVASVNPIAITYSMEILGPTGYVPIQVHAGGGEQVLSMTKDNIYSTTTVTSGFEIYTSNPQSPLVEDANSLTVTNNPQSSAPLPSPQTWTDNDTYFNTLKTNTIYQVQLFVDIGEFYDYTPGSQSFSLFVDPQFVIAASDPGAYSLVFSPGIGNGTAVPEPSTWAILLIGFVGVGFAGYRRMRGRVPIVRLQGLVADPFVRGVDDRAPQQIPAVTNICGRDMKILSLLIAVLSFSSTEAARAGGAAYCLALSGEIVYNRCPYTVAIVWNEDGDWKTWYLHGGSSERLEGFVESEDRIACQQEVRWRDDSPHC